MINLNPHHRIAENEQKHDAVQNRHQKSQEDNSRLRENHMQRPDQTPPPQLLLSGFETGPKTFSLLSSSSLFLLTLVLSTKKRGLMTLGEEEIRNPPKRKRRHAKRPKNPPPRLRVREEPAHDGADCGAQQRREQVPCQGPRSSVGRPYVSYDAAAYRQRHTGTETR